ncbi:PsbP-related protein [Chamaesiphon sp. VAR_48_metabat_135_sub]|uniref:PsbP-related protein n=1 Tax=Chamaesiphon sp. VAR_48_metabat_135_sub TaxID=2964699 RepID=UPI00286C26A5|nr:hypothetical protein [Chamaesiphon sp. VAR_48_metabat_135_sub]
MKKILPLLLLLSCLAGAQANSQQIANQPAAISNSWKQLDRLNYSLQYPNDWDLAESEGIGAVFVILAPLESKEDKFRENVNLVIEDLKGQTIDLDRYAKLSKGQLKAALTNFNLIDSQKKSNGGREYFKAIFTWDDAPFRLKVEQYYWIVDGKAYVLTFTSEQDKFANFSETGEKILNTFTFKK